MYLYLTVDFSWKSCRWDVNDEKLKGLWIYSFVSCEAASQAAFGVFEHTHVARVQGP